MTEQERQKLWAIDKEIIVIKTLLQALNEKLDNHIKHSWAVAVCALAAGFSAFGTLIVFLMRT